MCYEFVDSYQVFCYHRDPMKVTGSYFNYLANFEYVVVQQLLNCSNRKIKHSINTLVNYKYYSKNYNLISDIWLISSVGQFPMKEFTWNR